MVHDESRMMRPVESFDEAPATKEAQRGCLFAPRAIGEGAAAG
jgi:hypothetical protein